MNSRILVFLGIILFEIASHECAASKIFISYFQEVFLISFRVLLVMCPDFGLVHAEVSYLNLRYVHSVATSKVILDSLSCSLNGSWNQPRCDEST